MSLTANDNTWPSKLIKKNSADEAITKIHKQALK